MSVEQSTTEGAVLPEGGGPGKNLMAHLVTRGLTEYGAFIPGDEVREVLGIELPALGTQKEFQKLALQELNAVDYCRNALLSDGKYLGSEKGDYRIFLPSENLKQAEIYWRHARAKDLRAQRLVRNSPPESFSGGEPSGPGSGPSADNLAARIMLAAEGLKGRTKYGKVN